MQLGGAAGIKRLTYKITILLIEIFLKKYNAAEVMQNKPYPIYKGTF